MTKQTEDVMHLPWAGIFEPWRAFVAVAIAARPRRKKFRRPGPGFKPLEGLQMMLPLRPAPPTYDPQRPLFSLFQEDGNRDPDRVL